MSKLAQQISVVQYVVLMQLLPAAEDAHAVDTTCIAQEHLSMRLHSHCMRLVSLDQVWHLNTLKHEATSISHSSKLMGCYKIILLRAWQASALHLHVALSRLQHQPAES